MSQIFLSSIFLLVNADFVESDLFLLPVSWRSEINYDITTVSQDNDEPVKLTWGILRWISIASLWWRVSSVPLRRGVRTVLVSRWVSWISLIIRRGVWWVHFTADMTRIRRVALNKQFSWLCYWPLNYSWRSPCLFINEKNVKKIRIKIRNKNEE